MIEPGMWYVPKDFSTDTRSVKERLSAIEARLAQIERLLGKTEAPLTNPGHVHESNS